MWKYKSNDYNDNNIIYKFKTNIKSEVIEWNLIINIQLPNFQTTYEQVHDLKKQHEAVSKQMSSQNNIPRSPQKSVEGFNGKMTHIDVG